MLKDELQDKNAEKLNEIIDETINCLCEGRSDEAAEGLVGLARYYGRAGMPQSAFESIRKVIIGSAINKTGSPGFIHAKLQEAEETLKQARVRH